MKVIEPFPDIFVFRVPLRECRELRNRIASYREEHPRSPAPNSMNKYGLILSAAHAQWWIQLIQAKYITPIAAEHYPEINRLQKNPYAFVVDYEMDKQRSLAAHNDSANVTLNLCLEQKSGGGELVFYNKAGNRPKFSIEHRVGQAIVHRASHVHRAKPITSGFRSNLILWCAAGRR